MSVGEQAIILYAATRKHLMDIARKDLARFEKEFMEHVNTEHADVLKAVVGDDGITKELESKLEEIITEFKKNF